MALSTQLPPWLQSQMTERQEPWLLNSALKGLAAHQSVQEFPLRMQGMMLANQYHEAAIAHQGLQNEMVSRELNEEAQQLPAFESWVRENANDPRKLLDSPGPVGVTSKRLLNRAIALKQMAANSTLGEVYATEQLGLAKQAVVLSDAGFPLDEARNDDGSLDPQKVRIMSKQLDEQKQQRALELISARQEHYYDPFTGEPLYGMGRGGVGSLSAAQKDDALLTEYEGKLEAAKAAGDTRSAQTAQRHIDFLRSKHRNPMLEARLGAIKAEKAKVYEMMLYSTRNPARYAEYKKMYDDLEVEAERAITEAQGGAGNEVPPAAPTLTQPKSVGNFKILSTREK